MKITVKTYLNEGPGMLWKYRDGDRLAEGPEVVVGFPKNVPEKMGDAEGFDQLVADLVWPVGNKMIPDAAGNEWPMTTRSLSAGDVLVIGEAAYAIEPVGFRRLTTDQLRWSLDPKRAIHWSSQSVITWG